MIPLEEAQLKLKDIQQAVVLEKQHRYVNVQGKRKTFAQFVLEVVTHLKPFLGQAERSQRLLTVFKQYPFASLPERMSAIGELETSLRGMSFSQVAPKPAQKEISNQHGLDMAVQFVKGVGPKMAQLLKKAGIETVKDLLYYFPRKYLDYHHHVPISQLAVNQQATVVGTIQSVNLAMPKGRSIAILNLTVQDDMGGRLLAKWIYGKSNRRVLEAVKGKFQKGSQVMMSGTVKVDSYKNMLSMDRPDVEIISYADEQAESSGGGSLHVGRIVPVYPLVEGLNLKALRRVIRTVLDTFLSEVMETLPEPLRQRHNLEPLSMALSQIHFPESTQQYQTARFRLVFEELYMVQLRLAYLRSQFKQSGQALRLQMPETGYAQRLVSQLPFALTNAQQRVLDEIKADMGSDEPMYRLLQGDVGSGKTIVALLTLLIGVDNGYQGCLMAPTEILAEQHYRNFLQWLTPLGLKVGLLVGKQGAKERRVVRQGLLNGQIHIAVGTHALIQDDVEFANLGVIVIDEQHRFGVRQRMTLKNKAQNEQIANPEMLSMTATPIPRTLALTLHGDMDVSVIDELPPGRTPIVTQLMKGKKGRQEAYQLMRQQVISGRQIYIVFPLIEDSDTLSAKAATQEFEVLKNDIFPEYRVGLLHGRLSSDEKDAIMQDFLHGHLDILVSTTVIEVGVDVPNATVMMIENAERFGLSQLHQLRGRVGRGSHQSYCILVSDATAQESIERLGMMERSQNGFEIAEFDLEIRGPGDFLGTRQSGLPAFQLADIMSDVNILQQARQAAMETMQRAQADGTIQTIEKLLGQSSETTLDYMSSG